jgi:DNA-directed RNA polymerase specialized sigma24 family protein
LSNTTLRLGVVNALLQFDEVDRQIVVLHDTAGLTYAEVAAELLRQAIEAISHASRPAR